MITTTQSLNGVNIVGYFLFDCLWPIYSIITPNQVIIWLSFFFFFFLVKIESSIIFLFTIAPPKS